MMDYYVICYATKHGYEFLTGFETACCGTRFIPYFSRLVSDAIPLSLDHAKLLRDRLKKVCSLSFRIVPYSVKEVQE